MVEEMVDACRGRSERSTMKAQVVGLKETLRDLNKLDKELSKEIRKDIRKVSQASS
jgi:primase-polymerase (primpol)-like protein